MTSGHFDYFILTALPEEITPFLIRLTEPEEIGHGFSTSKLAIMKGRNLDILLYPAGCGQGTNKANTITTEAIMKYHPGVVLLSGIAGGFDEHGICLGDVLVPEYIDAYELAKKTASKPKIERRQPPFSVTATDFIREAKSIMNKPKGWFDQIKEHRPSKIERKDPAIHAIDRGVIGSGDKNLADRNAEERRYLKREYKDRALGFEMEAAGVAYACKEAAVPFAIVKGVQDNGTLDKDTPEIKDRWRNYAADAAAALIMLVIQRCSFFTVSQPSKRKTPLESPSGKRLEEIIQHKLLNELEVLTKAPNPAVLLDPVSFKPLGDRVLEIRQSILNAKSEILVICYSLTFWKDNIEAQLFKFLEKEESSFRVLMLMPDSTGFLEKSALESYQYCESRPQLEEWAEHAAQTRKAHISDIKSSINTMNMWQKFYGKRKIDFKFYPDTPILYGFSCDRKVFYISSYFINPLERGFRLPSRVLNKGSDGGSDLLISIFLNWFDIKFATGFDVSDIRWQQ